MKKVISRFKWSFALVTTLLGAGVCSAGPITYNINQIIGAGSITGILTTDGVIGVLATKDITSFNLNVMGKGGANLILTNSNRLLSVAGQDLTATATNLKFNFGGNDNGAFFSELLGGSGAGFCNATNDFCVSGLLPGPTAAVVPGGFSDPSAQFVNVTSSNQIIGLVAVPVPGPVTVPEPGTVLLFSLGLAGIFSFGLRRKSGQLFTA